MNVQEQIKKYISSQPEPKRSDLQVLHDIILQVMPACKLWFLDGKDSEGKTVSNPNIGYGLRTMKYADGTTREFYQIGLSANKTGISVYILGIEDKKYLAEAYGKELGKASVTGPARWAASFNGSNFPSSGIFSIGQWINRSCRQIPSPESGWPNYLSDSWRPSNSGSYCRSV